MSVDISIRKNGEDWTGEVDELRVPKVEGGNGQWHPEPGQDLILIALTVGAEGIYKAEDFGAYAISRLTVKKGAATHVEPDEFRLGDHATAIRVGGEARALTAKRIVAGSFGPSMINTQDTRTTRFYATRDGVYTPADEGYCGFTQVKVNYNSGAPKGRPSGYRGNDYPAFIAVTTPPDNTEYEEGDEIDYTGLEVSAFKSNGYLWANADYPNGIIPFDELIFEEYQPHKGYIIDMSELNCSDIQVSTFHRSLYDLEAVAYERRVIYISRYYLDNVGWIPKPITGVRETGGSTTATLERELNSDTLGTAYWTNRMNAEIDFLILRASKTEQNGIVHTEQTNTEVFSHDTVNYLEYNEEKRVSNFSFTEDGLSESFTKDGKTAYYNINPYAITKWISNVHTYTKSLRGVLHFFDIFDDTEPKLAKGLLAWYMLYGPIRDFLYDLPVVSWLRPMDNEKLSTTIPITMAMEDTR